MLKTWFYFSPNQLTGMGLMATKAIGVRGAGEGTVQAETRGIHSDSPWLLNLQALEDFWL